MQRFLHLMADREGPTAVNFEFVLVAGHFLMRDENLFTFFEGLSLRPPESAHGGFSRWGALCLRATLCWWVGGAPGVQLAPLYAVP